ncbi:DUF11 domain-containing protein [Spirosoma radiotolerans]|uniref:DUF11 domain-containing protein n=1 Tax=Spirosoma radiotolerans TaxID=1379870 RepID=A0A0E3ZYM2_9BACT|nr:DUF11 domain-containing protein [Spirosoma radiotolerans]AKD56883.1 hypothetical protein SD10_20205 [Spirosoma radiotolerans]
MKIHINKVGPAKQTGSFAMDYRHTNGLFRTYELNFFLKRLVLLFSLLIGLSRPAGAQTTANSVTLTNFADKSQATQGQTITHTLVLTNTGTTTVNGLVVRDSISTGLRYVPNTSSTPPGTTFTVGVPISTWSVASLSAGQSLSLTYQAVADSSGVLYSLATIPGDTAASCTSIPIKVCEGDTYLFQLTAPAGRSSYQWFKNGVEITGQTTRVLNVSAPGSYSLAVDNTTGKCPDFSLCPFIIEQYALPAFQASVLPASCSGSTAQANGQIKLTGFGATNTYQYSEGTDFNPSASLSGTPVVIPSDGLIASNLPNPVTNKTYTIRVYNESGCYVEKTVTLVPASCCSLVATATPGTCDVVTNTFSNTVAVTVVNPTAGVLTINDGPLSQTVATTGSGTVTAVFTGITSDGSTHTVTASLAGCSSTSATYTAPASCSVAPAQPSLALSVSPGTCVPATNQYTLSGTISLSAALAATLTLTDGTSSTTLAVTAGQTSAPFTLDGLLSGSGSHTLTVSGAGYAQTSATYTAPASCSVAPAQPSLALSVSLGACVPATNQYTLSGTISLSAALAATLTLTDGTSSTTLAVTAGQTSAPFTLDGLLSGSGSHTLTVSGAGYAQVAASYTAPASCSVAPAQPSLALSVNPGACVPATNQYTLSGTISLSAALAATLTLTDGTSSTTLAVTAGQTSAPFTLDGLLSGSGSHTLTVSGAGYAQTSATYTAPASCSVAPAQPSLALSVNPGACVPATNQYTLSGTISLSAALAATLTLTDGTSSTTLAVTAGQTSAPFTLDGLLSGSGSHTLTVSGAGYAQTSATYTAPASCSVAPAQPSLALSVSPGACVPATNQYTLSGTISLSAALAATLTLTDGTSSTTLAVTAGQTSAPFTLDGLLSGSGSHTLTVSGAGYAQVAASYTAPASCSVAPAQPSLALSVNPGACVPATNQYTLSGTISLSAALAATLTLTDGTSSTTLAVTAGQTSAPFTLDGLLSGSGSHTLTVSGAGYAQTSATYTAPASCSVAPAQPSLALSVNPGACVPATNQYTLSGTISLSAALAATLTLTDGTSSTTLAVTAGQTSAPFTLDGLLSGSGSHTLTVSGAGYAQTSATYTAPASCSVAPAQPSLALSVNPGACVPATNQYTLSGTISLSAALAATLTLTDGTSSTTLAVTAGQTSAPFTLDGLLSGSGSHTLTVSGAGYAQTSATYTAPASCSVAPAQPSLALSVNPGACVPATNQYTLSGTISLSAALAATLTLTDGTSSTTLAVTAGQTSAPFTLDGLLSGSGSHTLTVSGAGYAQTSATYTAPASCSVAPAQPSLALSVNPGACVPATNQYTLSGTISLSAALAATLTLTDGTSSTTLAVTAGQTSAPFTLDGLLSGSGSHTLTVSGAGYAQVAASYTAPASCSVAPAQPSLALSVSPGACVPATNQYTLSGTISLSAALAATLTLTDGTSSTTLAVTAGQTSAPFTLDGLLSGSGSHTLTVSGAGYAQTSATYTAPASCSVAPAQPSLALSVSPGACVPATNQYTLSGTISLSAALAATLTLTDGTSSTTLAVTAGQTSAPFTLDGLLSGSSSHTLTVSGAGYAQVAASYTAPASCSVAPALSGLTLSVVDPGVCNPGSNLYTSTGVIALANAPAGMATVTDGTTTTSVLISAGATSVAYSLTGLPSGSGAHTVTVYFVSQSASTTYVAPESCTVASSVPAVVALKQVVDKSRAKIGELISYTIVLTNTGVGSATATTVQLTKAAGLVYVANSAIPPAGTTFNPGVTVSSWTIASISAGQSLSLTYQAMADSSGIFQNTASIPGDTARVCTSIPAKVCVGESYLFRLTAAPGRSQYLWSRTFQGVTTQLTSFTTNVLEVTQPGEYKLTVDNQVGQCPDFSCCPFIVEEDSLPTFQASARPATCVGSTAQANGQLVISGFQPSYTYQYSVGSSFNEAASSSGVAKAIPAGGVLTSALANPATAQAYTIRVYNASGCYRDITVLLIPAVCGCPADVCVPFVINQTKRARRISDPH